MTLLEIIKCVFSFVNDWANIFLFGVGFVALIVYVCQKRDARRSAATELKEQITEIEDWLQNVRNQPPQISNQNVNLYQLGPILTENLWQKNRSILSYSLCEEDRKIIQRFYVSVEKVERARLDIVKCLIDSWYHKAYIEQKCIAEYHIDQTKATEESWEKLNSFIQDSNVFMPGICRQIFITANDIQMLTGTTAFKKLVKLSRR